MFRPIDYNALDREFRPGKPPSTEIRRRIVDLYFSPRKHPFLLALRRWERFASRNVCDSATKIPY